MFRIPANLNLPEINQEILAEWQKEGMFERSMKEREGMPSFVFYEGPPSANGMPGIHHVMARTIKDLFCRYKTMKGFHVKRKAGWDTHGLPVELAVEKKLGITKEDIGKKISVDDYNDACRAEVLKYTREWTSLTDSMGYWVDLNNPYITFDNRYIESCWWLLAQLYKKGLLYKGYTIQPYSPAAGTGLSTHELNIPGCYRDVKDTTCIALFTLVDVPETMQGWGKACLPAWTTTPWTLPSNTALCVGPSITYDIVRTYNPYSGEPITVAIASELVKRVLDEKGCELPLDEYGKGDKTVPWQIVGSVKGSELTGLHYKQLMPWVDPGEGAFRVIPGDYVSTDDGTGIVHIAGTFGADDNRVSKLNGIPPLHLLDKDGNIRPMVDPTGRFYRIEDLDPEFVKSSVNLEEYTPWAGKYVKNAFNPESPLFKDPKAADTMETLDVELCMWMKQQGCVLKIEKHTHSYPHCWRTDKPVLYFPLDSWFVATTKCRERMMELNDTILWKPAATGSGRFGKWLENIQDWNLSRSRYWGTPLPIWRTEDGSEELCIDSAQMLYDEIEKAVAAGVMPSNPLKDKGFVPGDYSAENYAKIDLHRPYADYITLVSASGKPMHRETDLIDVWFDSGAMPFAQAHYPFENKEAVDNGSLFPADFIAEGVDQTRGWFYTLHAIATMVFDKVSYKAVISNGLVRDKFGNKMSKRLGNAVDPFKAIAEFGSDAVRWYMISNSSPWDDLNYASEGVQEVSRKLFSTLFNTYKFFAPYANVDGFDPSAPEIPVKDRPEIDRWIISLLNSLIEEVDRDLAEYEPTKATRAITDFAIDNLSNWYVRLNRKRFWGGGMTDDKLAAYQTLYTCLRTLTLLMAPVAPFFSDALYRDLSAPLGDKAKDSVHLDFFPVADKALVDKELERRMDLAQRLTSMVLALRRKVNIKVRQPLQTVMVPVAGEKEKAELEDIKQLFLSEVNVKNLRVVNADEGILVKKVRPDFKKLGPVFGKRMKSVAAALQALDTPAIVKFESEGSITLELADGPATVELANVEIISQDIPGWLVANEGNLTVALDVTLTPELVNEGIAREIVNRIQNIRKARGYQITDRINLVFEPNDYYTPAIKEFAKYISTQVLADSLTIGEIKGNEGTESLDIEPNNLLITNITTV